MSMVTFGHFWKGLRLASLNESLGGHFWNLYRNIAVLRTFPFLTTRVLASLSESLDGHFWAGLNESEVIHF